MQDYELEPSLAPTLHQIFVGTAHFLTCSAETVLARCLGPWSPWGRLLGVMSLDSGFDFDRLQAKGL